MPWWGRYKISVHSYTQRGCTSGPIQSRAMLCILWGAFHNVQHIVKHGYEQYLAKYTSKANPSFNIDLPNNASDPQRYLFTNQSNWVSWGYWDTYELSPKSDDQLDRSSFYQQRLTQKSVCWNANMTCFNCKRASSSDMYMSTRFYKYLHRPEDLKDMTYPEFFKWWHKSSSDEKKVRHNQRGMSLIYGLEPQMMT